MLRPAWARKREQARADKNPYTAKHKAWLDLVDGKYRFKPGAKALLRRIFRMSADGYGCRAVAAVLNREKVPTWVEGSAWHDVFIRRVVRGREALGEFQPYVRTPDGRREPEGDPIAGYYPVAVTEAEWLAAETARKGRKQKGGRPARDPKAVNVFRGLLFDAKTGDTLNVIARVSGQRLLSPAGRKRRGEGGVSFPLAVFEQAVLSALAELDPKDVLGGEDDGPDEVAELGARLARLDAQLQAMADEYDGEDIPQIAAKVRAKNAERKDAQERLDAAKAKAASPLSAAWGDCKGLAAVLAKSDPEKARDLRLRLRAALARIVESVTCLFVGRSLTRLAAVQVRFTGGRHRDYLIVHTHAHPPGNRPPRTAVTSFAESGMPGDLDLRNPDHAARLAKQLDAAVAGPGT